MPKKPKCSNCKEYASKKKTWKHRRNCSSLNIEENSNVQRLDGKLRLRLRRCLKLHARMSSKNSNGKTIFMRRLLKLNAGNSWRKLSTKKILLNVRKNLSAVSSTSKTFVWIWRQKCSNAWAKSKRNVRKKITRSTRLWIDAVMKWSSKKSIKILSEHRDKTLCRELCVLMNTTKTKF